jgi:formylmethanofuran dehydrogenase subunit D
MKDDSGGVFDTTEQVEVVLISGRTTEQGTSLEIGKSSEEYFRNVAIVELSAADAEKLKIGDGDNVEISTQYGSVVVKGRISKGLEHGSAFVPYGPWANQVLGGPTRGTGMPTFRGVKAIVKPAEGREVQSLLEIVKAFRRGE